MLSGPASSCACPLKKKTGGSSAAGSVFGFRGKGLRRLERGGQQGPQGYEAGEKDRRLPRCQVGGRW